MIALILLAGLPSLGCFLACKAFRVIFFIDSLVFRTFYL
ncbi:hypothetical protein BN341_18200 [Helicobacter heilmannii ASB1.4]|nr:hypothetical protein BN341_18200 [Helicobacter heilmannii ASB1.4]